MFDKNAAISQCRTKVMDLMLETVGNCLELKASVDDFIGEPTGDTAGNIENRFAVINNNMEMVKNAITTLVKTMVSEDGEIEEVDGVEDEDGMRLM